LTNSCPPSLAPKRRAYAHRHARFHTRARDLYVRLRQIYGDALKDVDMQSEEATCPDHEHVAIRTNIKSKRKR
jgi:hypothetical protein